MQKITQSIIKKLYFPSPTSHKGANGRLLIIAGSDKYHGSVVLCASMASKMVDMVYLATTKDNFDIIKKTREKLAEFIYIFPRELKSTIEEADAILIGPGLIPNQETKKLVKNILTKYPDKKIILDAGALRALETKWLHKNCVITPHAGEFKFLFKRDESPENVLAVSKKFPVIIVAKGSVDYIAQNGYLWSSRTGNAGMTKGGTGDVLSGLLASLATKNDLLLSAQSAVYINGLAGDHLQKKHSHYYSASELVNEVRRILAR